MTATREFANDKSIFGNSKSYKRTSSVCQYFRKGKSLARGVNEIAQFLRNLAVSGNYQIDEPYWKFLMRDLKTAGSISFGCARVNPRRILSYNSLLAQCRGYRDYEELTRTYVHFLISCLPPAVALFAVNDLSKHGFSAALSGLLTLANRCDENHSDVRRKALAAVLAPKNDQ